MQYTRNVCPNFLILERKNKDCYCDSKVIISMFHMWLILLALDILIMQVLINYLE
jgi:hypothetical protein